MIEPSLNPGASAGLGRRHAVRFIVFLGVVAAAVIGMIGWGIGMGARESILRAAIAGMAPPERRGTAYGISNALYGVAWFIGSAALGLLYDRSLTAIVVASVVLQLLAVPVLLWLMRGRA